MSMSCYQFDPTQDVRWAEFLGRHPKVSVFHSVGWLTALRLTYGYEPVVVTTSRPDEELNSLLRYLQTNSGKEGSKYVEIRPVNLNFDEAGEGIEFLPAASHSLHILDLRPNLTDLFHSFDKDSVQRRIGRANRAGLTEKCGRSEDLLKDFYKLFVAPRRRHSLPPIPY